jgi:putative transcriptional regulator
LPQARFLSGQLLLAMPGIGDPRFERAVIAMCRHDEEGALGIGIGRVIPRLGFHSLLREFKIEVGDVPDVPVLAGGPVEPKRGFVLHSLDWGGQDSLHVGKTWALTGTLDILRAIGEGRGPKRWIPALGYAGWGAGQLDSEMMRHGWQLADGTDAILFETDVGARWSKAFEAQGIDPRLLASTSGRA